MKTRKEQMTSGGIDGYHNFSGDDSDYQDWFGVAGRSRDSDIMEQSNFDGTLNRLGGEGKNVRVERYKHWACGWIEEIYVRPKTKQFKIAKEIEESLKNYPVLDEDDYSEREWEATNEYWDNASLREKIEICKRCGESIFAARRDMNDAPDSVVDIVRNYAVQ